MTKYKKCRTFIFVYFKIFSRFIQQFWKSHIPFSIWICNDYKTLCTYKIYNVTVSNTVTVLLHLCFKVELYRKNVLSRVVKKCFVKLLSDQTSPFDGNGFMIRTQIELEFWELYNNVLTTKPYRFIFIWLCSESANAVPNTTLVALMVIKSYALSDSSRERYYSRSFNTHCMNELLQLWCVLSLNLTLINELLGQHKEIVNTVVILFEVEIDMYCKKRNL